MNPAERPAGTLDVTGIVGVAHPYLTVNGRFTSEAEKGETRLSSRLGHQGTQSCNVGEHIDDSERFSLAAETKHGGLVGANVITRDEITPAGRKVVHRIKFKFSMRTNPPSLSVLDFTTVASIANITLREVSKLVVGGICNFQLSLSTFGGRESGNLLTRILTISGPPQSPREPEGGGHHCLMMHLARPDGRRWSHPGEPNGSPGVEHGKKEYTKSYWGPWECISRRLRQGEESRL